MNEQTLAPEEGETHQIELGLPVTMTKKMMKDWLFIEVDESDALTAEQKLLIKETLLEGNDILNTDVDKLGFKFKNQLKLECGHDDMEKMFYLLNTFDFFFGCFFGENGQKIKIYVDTYHLKIFLDGNEKDGEEEIEERRIQKANLKAFQPHKRKWLAQEILGSTVIPAEINEWLKLDVNRAANLTSTEKHLIMIVLEAQKYNECYIAEKEDLKAHLNIVQIQVDELISELTKTEFFECKIHDGRLAMYIDNSELKDWLFYETDTFIYNNCSKCTPPSPTSQVS